jgi:hypothetical protein
MSAGLLLAAALLGQTADAPPVSPPPAQPGKVATAGKECVPAAPDPNTREIVVCAIKPEGYRIDPDVLKAKREARNHTHPKRPDDLADHSCRVVGPAPCMDAPMINLLGAAATLSEMADRLSKGEEIGSMFVTDPQPTEYQLYVEAKKEREAKEAEKAALAKAKAAAASHPVAAQPK